MQQVTAGELLRQLLSEMDAAQLAVVDPEHLLPGLAHHRVSCTVGSRLLARADTPSDASAHIRAVRHDQALKQLAAQADLTRLGAALDLAEVPWLILKGPVVAVDLYGGWPRREFADLDLLVDGRRLDQAIRAITDAGATLVDRNWPLIRNRRQAELTLVTDLSSVIDLHWHLLNSPERRQSFRIDTLGLFERARQVPHKGSSLPGLAREDQLLHLALHAAHSGGYRLQWLKDLERAVAAQPEQAVLLRRARAWRAELVTAVMLRRAGRTLHSLDGQDLARSLVPVSAWAALCAGAGRQWPVQETRAGSRSGRALFMATRSGTQDSVGHLLHAGARRRQQRADLAALALGWPDPNPLHLDVPDDAARREYLADVIRVCRG